MAEKETKSHVCPKCGLEQNRTEECIRCGAKIPIIQVGQRWSSKRVAAIAVPAITVAIALAVIIFLAVSGNLSGSKKDKNNVDKNPVTAAPTFKDSFERAKQTGEIPLQIAENPVFTGNYKAMYAKGTNNFTYYKAKGLSWKTTQTNLKNGIILGSLPGLEYIMKYRSENVEDRLPSGSIYSTPPTGQYEVMVDFSNRSLADQYNNIAFFQNHTYFVDFSEDFIQKMENALREMLRQTISKIKEQSYHTLKIKPLIQKTKHPEALIRIEIPVGREGEYTVYILGNHSGIYLPGDLAFLPEDNYEIALVYSDRSLPSWYATAYFENGFAYELKKGD